MKTLFLVLALSLSINISFAENKKDFPMDVKPPKGTNFKGSLLSPIEIVKKTRELDEDCDVSKPRSKKQRLSCEKTKKFLTSSCNQGNGHACFQMSFRYLEEFPYGKNPKKADALLRRGCVLKDGESCAKLGKKYQNGINVPSNIDTALKYYNESCNTGYAKGCTGVGSLFILGAKTKEDKLIGLAFLKRSCFEMKESGACYALADHYEKSDNKKLSKKFRTRADAIYNGDI